MKTRMCQWVMMVLGSFVAISAAAKDLGVHGTTYPIQETDLLVHIESKLKSIGEEKLREHQEHIRNKMVARIKRPNPVKGITKTTASTTRYFDPTFVVEEDILDAEGHILHAKGKQFNPLDIAPFQETWFLIDGEDPAQQAFARKEAKNHKLPKVILVKGAPGAQEDGSWHYFDQFGEISEKLGITKVPSVVLQAADSKAIEIQEVYLEH
jgi:conjugal transfer pilus assembly protein TraW